MDIYVTRDSTDNTPTDDILLVNQNDNTFHAENVSTMHVGENTFVGDYNGDGHMDVYVSAKETCNGVPQSDCTDIILINNGTGNFTKITLQNTW